MAFLWWASCGQQMEVTLAAAPLGKTTRLYVGSGIESAVIALRGSSGAREEHGTVLVMWSIPIQGYRLQGAVQGADPLP